MNFTNELRHTFKALIASCAFAATAASAAPVLIYEAGAITGVTGVTVQGKTYNVDFLEGSCWGAMEPCLDRSFAFKDRAGATAAATALAQQVFNNESLSAFIPGCSSINDCWFFTPYAATGTTVFSVAFHHAVYMPDRIEDAAFDRFQEWDNGTFARWGEIRAIPEPGSIALFSIAMAGIGFMRRKTKA